MSLDVFNALLERLQLMITPSLFQTRKSCNKPIYPEMVMVIGIRWLAGGSYHDLKDTFCVSKNSV
jgi:hypothetical protein